jgi:hypothetical protein
VDVDNDVDNDVEFVDAKDAGASGAVPGLVALGSVMVLYCTVV